VPTSAFLSSRSQTLGLVLLCVIGGALTVKGPAIPLAILAIGVVALLSAERVAQIVLFAALISGSASPLGTIGGFDIIYLLTWMIALALLVSERKSASRGTSLGYWAYGLFILGIMLSALVAGSSTAASSSLGLINHTAIFVLVLAMARRDPQLVLAPAAAALGTHVLIGLAELAADKSFFYGSWKLAEATTVDGIPRLTSTVADPNYFAVTLLLLSGVVAGLTLNRPRRTGYLVLSLAGLCLIPLTFSRAGIAAVLFALLLTAVFLRPGRRARTILTCAGIVLAAIAVLAVASPRTLGALSERFSPTQRSDASIAARSELQSRGVSAVLAHPVFGVGAGTFEIEQKAHLDPRKPFNKQTEVLNVYLQTALVGGLVALLGFLAILLLSIIGAWSLFPPLAFALVGAAVAIAELNALGLAPLWLALALPLARSEPIARIEPAFQASIARINGVGSPTS
jgi:O-antigen ligase